MSKNEPAPAEPAFTNSPFEEKVPPLQEALPREQEEKAPQGFRHQHSTEAQSTSQAVAMTQSHLHNLNAEFNHLLALICSQCSDVVNTLHAIQADVENR